MGFYLNFRSEARGLRSVENDVGSGDFWGRCRIWKKNIWTMFSPSFSRFFFCFGFSRFLLFFFYFSLFSVVVSLGLGKRERERGAREPGERKKAGWRGILIKRAGVGVRLRGVTCSRWIWSGIWWYVVFTEVYSNARAVPCQCAFRKKWSMCTVLTNYTSTTV